MRESPPASGVALQREIGALGFSAIALNGMIGAGIFGLPAIAVAGAGGFSPWLFVLCGVMIMIIVLPFAQVASHFDDTGGPVRYTTAAFGRFAGLQAGWLMTLSRVSSFAANAHLMVSYAGWFFPVLDTGALHLGVVLFVCLTLTFINIIGVRQGMATIFLLTALKLLPLCALVLLGLPTIQPELLGVGPPPLDALGTTALAVFYAFVGFDGAIVPAGEGKNPRRDLPVALIATTLAITLFYFLIQLVVASTPFDVDASTTPLADVAALVMGVAGAGLLTLGAVFSISGNLTASMLSAPRLLFALGRDGSLPSWFGQVHPRFHTPANAIAVYGATAAALALTGGFVYLAVMSTVVRLLVYGLCVAASFRLPRTEARFRVPGNRLLAILALVLIGLLLLFADARSWAHALFFALVGTSLFVTARWRSNR